MNSHDQTRLAFLRLQRQAAGKSMESIIQPAIDRYSKVVEHASQAYFSIPAKMVP